MTLEMFLWADHYLFESMKCSLVCDAQHLELWKLFCFFLNAHSLSSKLRCSFHVSVIDN